MTSPEPLNQEGETRDKATKPSPLWERMTWAAFVAVIMGLLFGGFQLSWVALLVVMVLMWVFVSGALTGSAGWQWVKDAPWFILAVAVGACIGWNTGNDLQELWSALQQIDDFDFYTYHPLLPSI